MNKTSTDLKFEEYLKQRCIKYQFEPYAQPGRIPDYLCEIDGKSILVECEEVESIPLDKVIPGTSGTVDFDKYIKILRTKIDEGSDQLKPHKDKHDFNVIIIGKKEGFDLDPNFLMWAMYGDPVIRVPISENPQIRNKPYFDMKVMGSMRRNKTGTREMYFPREYISGVGLIYQFNGFQHCKQSLYRKYCTNDESIGGNIEESINNTTKFFENDWKKYQDEIPEKFLKDPDAFAYKITVISNSLSSKPLPISIFNYLWDESIQPEVIHQPGFDI